MAVAFDAKSSGMSGGNTDTLVLGASANCAVVAFLWEATSTFSTRTFTVTLGGTSMTQQENTNLVGVGVDWFGVAIFTLLNPPTGSNTITITPNLSTNTYGGGCSYTGVGSIGTLTTATATSESVSASNSADMFFEVLTCCASSITSPAWSNITGTQRFLNTPDSQNSIIIGDAAGTVTTVSATLSGSGTEQVAALDLVAGTTIDKSAGAQIVVNPPNQFVGPQALRTAKRLPNYPIFFNPSPPADVTLGAQTSVLIPNQFVGPQALRAGKRLPYVTPITPPPGPVNNPLTPIINKMNKINTGQQAYIQILGDSTGHGTGDAFPGDASDDGGWPAWFGVMLGAYYNCNVNYYDVNEGVGYNQVAAMSRTSAVNNNTINILNGAVPATGLEGLGNEEYEMVHNALLACQLGWPYPDIVFVYDGYNDISNGTGITSGQWTASVETYLTGIGTGNGGVTAGYQGLINYVSAVQNGTQIVWTPQHYSWAVVNFATAYLPYQSAVVQALTGNPLPLQPILQPVTAPGYPNCWVLDTQQAWNPNAYTQAQIMSGSGGNGDPHPNDTGYQILATFILNVLFPQMFNAGYSYAPAVNMGNPNVGPMALRQRLTTRVPYTAFQLAGAQANLTATGTLSATAVGQTTGSNPAAPPVIIPNPMVGPMALRIQRQARIPYTAFQLAGVQANLTAVGQLSATAMNAGLPLPPLVIPNPMVGPMALRQQRQARVPYVPFQLAGVQANLTATGQLSATAVVPASDPTIGAQTAVVLSNPLVGPMALRIQRQARIPYVANQLQGVTAVLSATGQLSATVSILTAPPPPLIIPNPRVGPMALRFQMSTKLPYTAYQLAGVQANLTATGRLTATAVPIANPNLTATGLLQPQSGPAGIPLPPLTIPNPMVGPMALRQQRSARISYSATNTFATQANLSATGQLTATAVPIANANLSAVGRLASFDEQVVAPTPPLIIPNPMVGPMALRQRMAARIPYSTFQLAGVQGNLTATGVLTATAVVLVPNQAPLIIPNPFVGPMAMRQRMAARIPYTPQTSATGPPAATGVLSAVGQLSATAMNAGLPLPPLVIPNPHVGPMALRFNMSTRVPYTAYQLAGVAATLTAHGQLTSNAQPAVTANLSAHGQLSATAVPISNANLTATGTLGAFDMLIVPPPAPLIIANPRVGPMALRFLKLSRIPVPPMVRLQLSTSVSLSATGLLSSVAQGAATPRLSAHGQLTATAVPVANANLTAVGLLVTVSRVIGVPIPPLIIPNPFVGPMALRYRMAARIPYTAQNTSLGIPDSAQLTATGTLKCFASVYGVPGVPSDRTATAVTVNAGVTANVTGVVIANTTDNTGVANT